MPSVSPIQGRYHALVVVGRLAATQDQVGAAAAAYVRAQNIGRHLAVQRDRIIDRDDFISTCGRRIV